jgi:aspartate 1-decarboxylase
MLKSKIHRAKVTASELEYEGSITIDRDLLAIVKIRPYEKVLVANLANGKRFETYAIPAPAGSGTVCLNGATAHRGSVGDRITIFAFAALPEAQADAHRPLIIVLDENNRPQGGLRGL